MQTWIALLRGINVGGRNKMPMATLATTLKSAGCLRVRTYIQSGNVVFVSSSKSKPNLTQRIGDATEEQFGFRPHILLLTAEDFSTAVKDNPFPEAVTEPKTLHFFFLDSLPDSPDLEGLAEVASPTERYALVNSVFYLHTPGGLGRSKLASVAERKLGVPATARNYRTIRNLSAMVDSE